MISTTSNCSPLLPKVFDGATRLLSAKSLASEWYDPDTDCVKTQCQLTYFRKLKAAKQYLGDSWVLSPLYNNAEHPAHSAWDCHTLRTVRKQAVVYGKI